MKKIQYLYRFNFDDKGRICLGKLIDCKKYKAVYAYIERPNKDTIFLYPRETYSKKEAGLLMINTQNRVVIPKDLRGDATGAYFGRRNDTGELSLWLQYD